MAYLEKTVQEHPAAPLANMALAMAYRRASKHEAAVRQFAIVVGLGGRHESVLFDLCVCYDELKNYEMAYTSCKEALALSAENKGRGYEGAQKNPVLLLSGLDETGRELLYRMFGRASESLKLYKDAAEAYSAIISANPTDTLLHLSLAKAYDYLEDLPNAIKYYTLTAKIESREGNQASADLLRKIAGKVKERAARGGQ